MIASSAALITVAFINLLIGLVIFLRNPKSSSNIAFMYFVSFVALWSFGLAFFNSVTDESDMLLWSRLYYVAAIGIAISLLVFSKSYMRDEQTKIREVGVYALIAATLSSLIVFVSGFLIREVSNVSGSNTVILGKPEYLLYTLLFVSYFLLAIKTLYSKKKRATQIEKMQIDIVATGVLLAGLFGMFFNLFLPWVDDYSLIWIGPQFSIVMVILLAYGMFKHKLFDIRSIIVRPLVYILVLFVIAALYAAFVFGFLSIFIDLGNVSTYGQIALIASAVFISFTYEPIKTSINRTTKKLFYRDEYDSQQVLDKLSSLLATEIELNKIISQSSQVLFEAIRPIHLRFSVFKDGETYIDYKLGESSKAKLSRADLNSLSDVVAVADLVPRTEKHLFKVHDAAVILKLKTNEEIVGVILLGPKQSGTVYSKQDIDLLTISEKELAIAVQNSRYFEQIQEFNVKLQKEVQDATSELRASNTKLKELDEAKDEFISMASHQLRTPLTSVKGYISMVNEGDAGKVTPAQRKLLDEAFASSQRMVYLIADLLNVSRLRTGKFVIEPAEVYLPDVVREEVHQLEPTARSRKLKLVFDKPARFPKIWLDETKIRQVVMNFIDNAIYYTPAGGRIEIRLTAKKNGIEYTVRDNGIGVPKEEQAKLFTKFYRAGNAKQARPDGTGLGLYMAQRVVSAQGGSVVFQSEPGKGSTFGFFFPFKSVKTRQSLEKVAITKQNQSEPSEL